MAAFDPIDPRSLHRVLETAATENWCARTNCTTCASEQLRIALGLLDKTAARAQFIAMTPDMAVALIDGLKLFSPQTDAFRFEEATRWVLYEIWRNFGDRYFSRLDRTWTGDVLGRMREHHLRRLDARRVHEARQGVKKRDWKE